MATDAPSENRNAFMPPIRLPRSRWLGVATELQIGSLAGEKWVRRDSNPEPSHYEWPALTVELQTRWSNLLAAALQTSIAATRKTPKFTRLREAPPRKRVWSWAEWRPDIRSG